MGPVSALQVQGEMVGRVRVGCHNDPVFCGKVILYAGDLTVLSPEDAHKPRCAAGAPMAVKKIVLKVPVASVLARV